MAGFNPRYERTFSADKPSKRPETTFLDEGNQYVVDCVQSVEELARIRDAWVDLEQITTKPYIYFQSFDWVYEWCRIHCDGSQKDQPQMRIFILWRNNKLAMVWPLMASNSITGLKNLCFLTEPLGQYGNIIIDEAVMSVKVGKRVWEIIKKSDGIDAITLDQYPENSMLRDILDGSGIIENSEKHASILNLDGFETWEDYVAGLSKKQRKQRNQKRNKLGREGEIGCEVHYGGSERYRELVNLSLLMKQDWLRETGRRATVLSRQSTFDFLTKLTGRENNPDRPNDAPEGAVLIALTLDGKPIALEIGFCLSRHYYCYLGAFDWSMRDFSPGKIQMEESQKWAKSVGISKFDFLGDPADYKSSWTDEEDPIESRSVAVSWKGYVYCSLWKARLRPTIRKAFNNMSADKRTKLLALMGIGKPSKAKMVTAPTPAGARREKPSVKTDASANPTH